MTIDNTCDDNIKVHTQEIAERLRNLLSEEVEEIKAMRINDGKDCISEENMHSYILNSPHNLTEEQKVIKQHLFECYHCIFYALGTLERNSKRYKAIPK